jgi:hypothetical protein
MEGIMGRDEEGGRRGLREKGMEGNREGAGLRGGWTS